jgi:hypothetical protein
MSLALLVVLSSLSEGWTAKTYQVIVVQSVKLMPESFRNVMLRHQEEILSGCLRPDDSEEAAHKYDLTGRAGFLQDRVLELSEQIPEKIYNHVRFRELAVDFGKLSHYMADLNDPLLLEDTDIRESQYREDFPRYQERNLEKFPWIFSGHDDPLLQQDRVTEYIHSVAARTARHYSVLGDSYFPDGVLVSSDTFDPKSLPFGIASLSYSNSITDTIRIWFYSWKKAHGDISRTPFYRGKSERRTP